MNKRILNGLKMPPRWFLPRGPAPVKFLVTDTSSWKHMVQARTGKVGEGPASRKGQVGK